MHGVHVAILTRLSLDCPLEEIMTSQLHLASRINAWTPHAEEMGHAHMYVLVMVDLRDLVLQ
jgi:hypothetical protein